MGPLGPEVDISAHRGTLPHVHRQGRLRKSERLDPRSVLQGPASGVRTLGCRGVSGHSPQRHHAVSGRSWGPIHLTFKALESMASAADMGHPVVHDSVGCTIIVLSRLGSAPHAVGGAALGWSCFGASDHGPVSFRRVGQSVDLPVKARRWGHDLRGSPQSGCLKPWSRPPQPQGVSPTSCPQPPSAPPGAASRGADISITMDVYTHVVQDTQREAMSHTDRLLRRRSGR